MKLTKVLFVCLGNICRSPAAEAVFKSLIHTNGLQDHFFVDSCGTGDWHVGRMADPRMRNAASERGIDITSRARQFDPLEDFEDFDYIVAMDNENYAGIIGLTRQIGFKDKVVKMMGYSTKYKLPEGVPDPYYGGDEGFDNVLDILEHSLTNFLHEILKKKKTPS